MRESVKVKLDFLLRSYLKIRNNKNQKIMLKYLKVKYPNRTKKKSKRNQDQLLQKVIIASHSLTRSLQIV